MCVACKTEERNQIVKALHERVKENNVRIDRLIEFGDQLLAEIVARVEAWRKQVNPLRDENRVLIDAASALLKHEPTDLN